MFTSMIYKRKTDSCSLFIGLNYDTAFRREPVVLSSSRTTFITNTTLYGYYTTSVTTYLVHSEPGVYIFFL